MTESLAELFGRLALDPRVEEATRHARRAEMLFERALKGTGGLHPDLDKMEPRERARELRLRRDRIAEEPCETADRLMHALLFAMLDAEIRKADQQANRVKGGKARTSQREQAREDLIPVIRDELAALRGINSTVKEAGIARYLVRNCDIARHLGSPRQVLDFQKRYLNKTGINIFDA